MSAPDTPRPGPVYAPPPGVADAGAALGSTPLPPVVAGGGDPRFAPPDNDRPIVQRAEPVAPAPDDQTVVHPAEPAAAPEDRTVVSRPESTDPEATVVRRAPADPEMTVVERSEPASGPDRIVVRPNSPARPPGMPTWAPIAPVMGRPPQPGPPTWAAAQYPQPTPYPAFAPTGFPHHGQPVQRVERGRGQVVVWIALAVAVVAVLVLALVLVG